ncbi:Hypothetical protein IALB_2011 [Ignavibacterium album JCM 16511]|uniref:Uncharacterized protein n=1 Tax=Ignavibacterium album (strain DSM 19864 / JCM 16511 / NBRC 101810 / Mat9-16) TaxID=945713 RepID=I0AL59_IGNAJ|nr:hypothetical protein [Ignavibacterium album]AFH49716.1 Hypothetical protein IALB_2011 [Ignavibacterium album JCM 16511]
MLRNDSAFGSKNTIIKLNLNMRYKILLLSVWIIFVFSSDLLSQQSKLSKSVNQISEYIASEKFLNLKNEVGDLASVDSIFSYALKVNKYDYSETLLSLMFATVPYRDVPIQTPILRINLYYPLISADPETFNQKNKNLPRYLFIDSPQNDYGDLDKLAHFFGSAFLSYNSNIFDLGELIGYFVEVFEESFKVQSEIDFRDIDVNYYGRLFGKLLKNDKTILPSQIILLRSIKFFSIIL